jgi:hypothetical protein
VPLGERLLGRPAQDRADEGVAGGQREQEMRGGLLGGRPGGDEQLGGPSVGAGALVSTDLLVDGCPHHRVDELQRVLDAQETGADQHRRGPGGRLHVQVGQGRGVLQMGPVPQHGGGPHQGGRRGGQAGQPERDRPGHRLRARLEHTSGVGGGRDELFPREGVEQRLQVQRVAPGRRVARVGKGRVGFGGERLAGQRRHRRRPQRAGPCPTAAGSASTSVSSDDWRPCSGGRAATATSSGSPSSRRAR